jgi:hypothetical protein
MLVKKLFGIWRKNRAARGPLYVSVGIVFSTFTEIRFTKYIFSTIVTPKYLTNIIVFRVKKTEILTVEIAA